MKHLIILTCLICSMSAGAQVKKNTSDTSHIFAHAVAGSYLTAVNTPKQDTVSCYMEVLHIGNGENIYSKWHKGYSIAIWGRVTYLWNDRKTKVSEKVLISIPR